MSERLAELQRQRALLQEHLAWLDRELAAEAGRVGSGRQAAPPPASLPENAFSAALPPASAFPTPPPAATDPDAILAQYSAEPEALKADVRKGCFIYLAFAFVVLGLGVTALYFYTRGRH